MYATAAQNLTKIFGFSRNLQEFRVFHVTNSLFRWEINL